MVFSTLASKEMIMKSSFFLILIHLIFIKVSHGYLGCADKLVPCLNQTHCINIKEVCIDHHNCIDEHGEEICNHCPKGSSNGIACVTHNERHLTFECISSGRICDGKQDCISNEDEDSCNVTKCGYDSWLCEKGTCIEKTRLCDGSVDCPDGSDEHKSICHSTVCGLNKIHCPTGECIEKSKLCDGISHCPTAYEVQDCGNTESSSKPESKIKNSCSISSNIFSCSTSTVPTRPTCLSADRVCDGYKDCPKGDDEHECEGVCTPPSICPAHSDIICIQHTVVGQLCRCNKTGYRVTTDSSQGNTPKCQDFNECNDSNGTYCSFNCINTNGSFNCTCPLGFSIDNETKACHGKNDLSKPNLLMRFNDSISLYSISTTANQYTSKVLDTIKIGQNHHFDYMRYDPNQMFIIYYDQMQHKILCQSKTTSDSIVLLSNLTVHGFAYDANEKTLFIVENLSKTLRMYVPIICDESINIKMHSWSLNNISNSIHSMEIDVYNRQLIFASNHQFMISNMSEPNSTKVVHKTDREIKRFIYDPSFKRLFWTAINITSDELFPVYTCDSEFKQCHDTSIRLVSAWSFAFYDDGLLYTPSSRKSLDIIQVYGKSRFSQESITSTRYPMHSFSFIYSQSMELPNLRMKNSTESCENKLRLQINANITNCLSIDANFTSMKSTMNTAGSSAQSATTSSDGNDSVSQVANQQKTYRYLPSNKMLFVIISIGAVGAVLAFFVKRCHNRLNRKATRHVQIQDERCFGVDEPNLDEFTIMGDDRNGDRLPLTNQLNY